MSGPREEGTGPLPRRQRREIAATFGVAPELLPFLPRLLADLWALGGWPAGIVKVLRESAGLPAGARVADLGCGKGAVAVAIARELGHRVRGIDLFPPFVQEAAGRARAAGVAEACRFEVGDARQAVRSLRGYDAALCAALGAGLFGGYAGCVGELRKAVRSGGYVVLNDGFLLRGASTDRPGYGYYRSHAETLRELTAGGDRLVRELLLPGDELAAANRQTLSRIRRRAEELGERHPEHAGALARYVESEAAECAFLEAETGEAVWLLRCR